MSAPDLPDYVDEPIEPRSIAFGSLLTVLQVASVGLSVLVSLHFYQEKRDLAQQLDRYRRTCGDLLARRWEPLTPLGHELGGFAAPRVVPEDGALCVIRDDETGAVSLGPCEEER